MSKTFLFVAKNSSICVTISADNEEDALQEIQEYFDDDGVDDLKLEKDYEHEES